MEKQKRVYKWYLILSIIYSVMSILTVAMFFKPSLSKFIAITAIWAPIVFIWFVFNIIMIVIFKTKKIEKIAFWLPALYIIDQIFSALIGFGAAIVIVLSSGELEFAQMLKNPIIIILSLIFPVITLILAVKLNLRK